MLRTKLTSPKPAMVVGKISLGKYTCWISEEFETREDVQREMVREMELKIRIPIMIFSGSMVSAISQDVVVVVDFEITRNHVFQQTPVLPQITNHEGGDLVPCRDGPDFQHLPATHA